MASRSATARMYLLSALGREMLYAVTVEMSHQDHPVLRDQSRFGYSHDVLTLAFREQRLEGTGGIVHLCQCRSQSKRC